MRFQPNTSLWVPTMHIATNTHHGPSYVKICQEKELCQDTSPRDVLSNIITNQHTHVLDWGWLAPKIIQLTLGCPISDSSNELMLMNEGVCQKFSTSRMCNIKQFCNISLTFYFQWMINKNNLNLCIVAWCSFPLFEISNNLKI